MAKHYTVFGQCPFCRQFVEIDETGEDCPICGNFIHRRDFIIKKKKKIYVQKPLEKEAV